jgi:DMSO/TMAO reductase YedYZ molybdopterin-dependent catalytic subunit
LPEPSSPRYAEHATIRPILTSAALDRLLAILVVALATTGLITLRIGHPDGAWLFAVHGVLAGALAGALVTKVRRSLPRALEARRAGRIALSLLVTLVAAAALTGGWLWAASGEVLWLDAGAFGRWTVLTLHAWIGLALVPVLVAHLIPRRWRLLRPGPRALQRTARLVSRRSLLIGAGLATLGFGTLAASAVVETVRGGRRRFTGSRWLPAGGIPPATTFFGEPPPNLDPGAWRVRVGGSVAVPRTLTLDELRSVETVDESAILDCTSGWAIETVWRGVTVGALLDSCGVAPTATDLTIRSATGWSTVMPIDEARRCLLAWEVAGRALPVGNGAPLRLVAPNRRGLDWVKWVTSVEVA